MKKLLSGSLLIAFVASAALVSSCGNNKSEGHDHAVSDTLKTDTLHAEKAAESNEIMYLVPAPGEMLRFIKENTGKVNKNTSFLNPHDNVKNYADLKSKALNFGIYSCDLSYSSIFEIGGEALNYMKVVKKLGDNIGVSSIVQPEMIKRIEANISHPDSLEYLSNDIYLSSFEYLQESEQGPTLAMVIAGGYIESLHIVCSITKFEAKSPAIARIAEQKYTLDNIIEFMKKHESDGSVAEVVKELEGLKGNFDGLTETPVETPKSPEKGRKTIGGGSIIEMNAEQFKAISDKVKSIRNSFAHIN